MMMMMMTTMGKQEHAKTNGTNDQLLAYGQDVNLLSIIQKREKGEAVPKIALSV
jgi:hypothetical protein